MASTRRRKKCRHAKMAEAARLARCAWRISFAADFGPTRRDRRRASDRAGDVAVVLMRLAQAGAAGEQQVVQFGRVARRHAAFKSSKASGSS